MIKTGEYNLLKVQRLVEFGAFLEDGKEGLLLPKRFVPPRTRAGDTLSVFVYHDSEDRLIATTQKPLAKVGEIAYLEVVSVTGQGAFLDWGLMKDLFVPKSKQLMGMRLGGHYLVKIYLDEQTGRVAASDDHDVAVGRLPGLGRQAGGTGDGHGMTSRPVICTCMPSATWVRHARVPGRPFTVTSHSRQTPIPHSGPRGAPVKGCSRNVQ